MSAVLEIRATQTTRRRRQLRLICTCGTCQSCRMRSAWAKGKFDNRRRGIPWDAWTPEEEALLRQLAGTMDLAEIARVLTERFGIPRSVNAVDVRCQRLGISHWRQGYCLRDIELIFRLHHRAIVRWWVQPGLLRGERWSGRGPNQGWVFHETDVERFIREYPWAYDWTRMKRGHPLSRLAEVVNRADPWLTYEDLRRYVGIARVNLDRWRRRGLVPHQFRPKGGPGQGRIIVRARDFRAIKAAIEAARADAKRQVIKDAIATRQARARQ